jgi:Xaa-Pro aminopeptidase
MQVAVNTIVIYIAIVLNHVHFGISQNPSFSCEIRPNQGNTGDKLKQLRTHIINNNLTAYVIVSEDEHQSEYVQLYDERRAWISGFTGSSGIAVVTRDKAALWTDGRYWTQAEDELDCRHWLLMRQGQSNVPSLSNWLISQIDSVNNLNRIGVAAQFVSSDWWSSVNNTLSTKNATLVEVTELIDYIWPASERPPAASNPIFVHELKYTGVSWKNKVKVIAEFVRSKKATAFIVTALDDVAWLLSVRGSDIPYNPFFKVGNSHFT